MTKSKETVLYGVRGYQERKDMAHPDEFARLRTYPPRGDEQLYGKMATPEGTIMWFVDPGARDDFFSYFGGVKVTLARKIEVVTGDKATTLLKGLKQ